jgi:cytochrome c oxidase subunit 1
VKSVLFGKPLLGKVTLTAPSGPPLSGAVASYGSAGTLRIPGTLVLVGIFLTAFVLYYFVNWKYLSEIWPMR